MLYPYVLQYHNLIMENEKKCLYSIKGNCVLSERVNRIFGEIRSVLGPDLDDEKIYEMIEKRYPQRIAPHATEVTNIIIGSSCANCLLRKRVIKN